MLALNNAHVFRNNGFKKMNEKNKNVTIIIPVQFSSKNLLGKPLVKIAGISLIHRLHQKLSHLFNVVIATDNQEIYNEANTFSKRVIISSKVFRSGTDRVYYTAKEIGLYDNDDNHIIINLQANEPNLTTKTIEKTIEKLQTTPEADVVTIIRTLNKEYINEPNIVKTTINEQGNINNFSRSYEKNSFHHLGVYAYNKQSLKRFALSPSSENEKSEKLEQMRGLSIGLRYFAVQENIEQSQSSKDQNERYVEEVLKSQHYFYKTLETEREAIKSCHQIPLNNIQEAINLLLTCNAKVIVCGLGKTGYVAQKFAATLCSTGTQAVFLHAAEAAHGDSGIIGSDDICVLISHSGESPEIALVSKICLKQGTKSLAITHNKNSLIAQNSDVALIYPFNQEADPLNIVPTASTTAALAICDGLAVVLMKQKEIKKEDFARWHPGGNIGKVLKENEEI